MPRGRIYSLMPSTQKAKKKMPPAARRLQTARRLRQEEEQTAAEKAKRPERPVLDVRRSRKRDGELFTI